MHDKETVNVDWSHMILWLDTCQTAILLLICKSLYFFYLLGFRMDFMQLKCLFEDFIPLLTVDSQQMTGNTIMFWTISDTSRETHT